MLLLSPASFASGGEGMGVGGSGSATITKIAKNRTGAFHERAGFVARPALAGEGRRRYLA